MAHGGAVRPGGRRRNNRGAGTACRSRQHCVDLPHATAAPAYSVGLSSVACTSGRDCFGAAYVSYSNSDANTPPLVETRNGEKWTLGTAPLPAGGQDGNFNAVTCPSASECVAVGRYFTATSAAIPLAEIWHGKAWAPVTVPAGAAALKDGLELTAVSCSSAANCAVIGISYATYTPVAYNWNGKRFTQVTLPPAAKGVSFSIGGLSCPSASRCVAVGGYSGNTGWLAETWNGKTWTPVKLSSVHATGAALEAVSCVTATQCFAVGNYRTATGYRSYADVLTGSTWKAVPLTPAAKGDEYLDGLSCTSATDCLATGATEAKVPYELSGIAYAEAWNGKTWSVEKVPSLPGAKGPGTAEGSSLDSVSCVSSSYCLAVGTAGATARGVSAVWNGKTWTKPAVAAS